MTFVLFSPQCRPGTENLFLTQTRQTRLSTLRLIFSLSRLFGSWTLGSVRHRQRGSEFGLHSSVLSGPRPPSTRSGSFVCLGASESLSDVGEASGVRFGPGFVPRLGTRD